MEIRDANKEKLETLELEKGNLKRALDGFKNLAAAE